MHRDANHHRSVAGALIAGLSLAGLLAAADPVAEALSAVRDNKRDMYDTTSSVLGTLDSPATLAALQLACRPIPGFQPGQSPTLSFDAATTQRLVALAAEVSAHLTKERSRGRAVFPLATTGAQIRDLIGSPAFTVIHVVPAAPAEHQLAVGDVIVGANGHLFSDSEDPRPELGSALSDSQGPELHGVLTLQVVRQQHPLNVAIALPTPMRYGATWPDHCPKTVAIRQASLANVLTEQGTQFDFWTPLYLLASGDDAALERARRYIYDYLHGESAREAVPAGNSWIISYHLLATCEYYQLTGDAEVLPEIAYSVRILERQQFASGGWSHGEPGGYGEINNVGIIALMALVQARDCGAPVSPVVLAKAIRYFGQWCGTNLPYGMGTPGGRSGRMDNGMSSAAAITFSLLGEQEMAQRWARSVCYMWMGRERGHAESIFNMAWGPLGAALAPAEEYHMFMQKMIWYYELARTSDQGFVYMSNTHWSYGADMTAAVGLGYYLPEKRLRIMGAPRGVFCSPAPSGLETALRSFHDKSWSRARQQAEQALSAHPDAARQLLAACAQVERQAAVTLRLAQEHCRSGQRATAKRQLEALLRFLGTPGAAASGAASAAAAAAAVTAAPTEPLPAAAEAAALLATLGGTVTDATIHRPPAGAFVKEWEAGLPSSEQFAYSPQSIAAFNRQALSGLPLTEIAKCLGHFASGPADGAVLALAGQGAAAVPLLQRLLTDSHPYVRAGALASLAAMAGPAAAASPASLISREQSLAILHRLADDRHPEVQRSLASYLSTLQLDTPETRQLILRIAGHEDPSVRVQALSMCTRWVSDPATCVEAARLVIAAPLGGTPGDWDTANALVARYRDQPIARNAIPAMAAFLRNEADTKPYRGFFSDGAHFRAMEIMQAQWDAQIEAIPDLVPGLCRSYVRVPYIHYDGWIRTRTLALALLNRCGRASVAAIRQTVAEEQAWLAAVSEVKLKETTQGDGATARTTVAGFIQDLVQLADRIEQHGTAH